MMKAMTGACVKFGGVSIYRSQNPDKIRNATLEADISPLCLDLGQRQRGKVHELVAYTGQDMYSAFEAMYEVTLPEAIKALPINEGFVQLGTNPQYSPIADQAEAFERAMSSGGMFDIGPSLNLSSAYFQYLGYCQGKGQTADGTPVNVINLDA